MWSLDLAKTKPLTRDFNAAYKEWSGIDLDQTNSRYVTQLHVLVHAMNRAGSTDPEKLRQAIEETDIPESDLIMAHGVKFDKNHDNPLAAGVVGQRKDGYTHIVFPEKFATMKYVFPMTAWDKR